jgi:hypothetical protein
VWTRKEWLVGGLFVQMLQKETHHHENEQDKSHVYIEMLHRDKDNQDERNYILRTPIEMNRNPTYEHDMEAKKKKIRDSKGD